MPILQSDLEHRLKAAFPQGQVVVTDLAGDNDHYQTEITCITFKGLSRIQQHQKVYTALKDCDIHALSIKTNYISGESHE
jgi:stress-induced morphogen